MLNRLFGNYLVSTKHMTQEQLDSILPVSKDSKADVETIAVVDKTLTPAQVQEILAGINLNKERFGETAIQKGVLTDERLDQLILLQTNSFMRFIQQLLDQKLIKLDEIPALLDEFQRNSEYTDPQMHALLMDDLESIIQIFVPIKNRQLKELSLILFQTLKRLVDPDVYLDKAYTATSIQLDRYVAQMLTGSMHLKLYVTGQLNHLLGIANYFEGGGYTEVTTDALDSVAEFVNCVSGLFATNLSYDNILVDLAIPDYSLEGSYLSTQKLYIIPFHVNGCTLRAVYELY